MDFASVGRTTKEQIIVVYLVFWVISTALSAMPEPVTTSNGAYRWFYTFAHGLLASWGSVSAALKSKAQLGAK